MVNFWTQIVLIPPIYMLMTVLIFFEQMYLESVFSDLTQKM